MPSTPPNTTSPDFSQRHIHERSNSPNLPQDQSEKWTRPRGRLPRMRDVDYNVGAYIERSAADRRWLHHEPLRTFSNHIITEIARCVEFCDMSSEWFDCTKPSLSTSLQGKQGVQCAYALVRGGSSISNLVEPSRTTSLQR